MRWFLAAMVLVFSADAAFCDLFMRVVDTGSGLCCVIRTHDDHFIVYDMGHWNAQGYRAQRGVEDMVPAGEAIDLMVLSHSDSDHLGGTKGVFEAYEVKKVVTSGFVRDTGTWEDSNQAIEDEEDCEVINLANDELPGPITYGETTVTFVAGWHAPPDEWSLSGGEYRNAGSICIRIEYVGKAILLCGDAVGRHLGDASDVCIATEEFMCDNADETPIAWEIVVAPHHGADNGSSTRFVQTVDPTWVIFSAGHAHQHPTDSAANRYHGAGYVDDHGMPTAAAMKSTACKKQVQVCR